MSTSEVPRQSQQPGQYNLRAPMQSINQYVLIESRGVDQNVCKILS